MGWVGGWVERRETDKRLRAHHFAMMSSGAMCSRDGED